ncbi:CatB-related O-acetyltransferase [Cyclobacterium sp.]|uniref:CatB-related O-acetyltransferase n=1 Tax=Cyclobacterium sp. TaxID=1966343 RepID=UPI0019C379F4|nr:CatB-related O-acetyltransferase [Cyclobacterium sp.]MBD3627915.1 CatB-related O-acetyltransferase [Cyclobacterium sp.]
MSWYHKIFRKLVVLVRDFNDLRISQGAFIHRSAILKGTNISGNVFISEGCKILKGVHIRGNSKITIGKYTSINGPSTDILSGVFPVHIGSFCSIARNVSIQEYNHHADRLSTYFINKNILGGSFEDDIVSKGNIEIGNDVWIGTKTVVLSGAKIGHGAIIGANSVVKGIIPAFAIAVGSPAKVVKYRFNQETIDKILEMKWWDWDLEKIKANRELFTNFRH